MQKCLSENCWDERWIEDRIDEAVRVNLGDLFKLNVSVEDAKREIIGRAKGLQVFSQRYLSETPKVSCGPGHVVGLAKFILCCLA